MSSISSALISASLVFLLLPLCQIVKIENEEGGMRENKRARERVHVGKGRKDEGANIKG